MKYVPLYIKTHNSLLTSLIKIDELIEYAKKYGYDTLTITDNNMYGVMEFYKKCLSNNIKPIIGLEVKIEDNILVLYCMNDKGYRNLLKLTTIASERPLMIDDLQKYNQDLISIVPYASLNIYDSISKIYKYTFKSYQNIDERNNLSGDNLVYMNEILYLDKKDEDYLKYLIAIREGTIVDNINIESSNKYLKTIEEIKSINEEDLINNYRINELCNLNIEFHKNLLPIYECPNNMSSYDYLKMLCKEGLRRLFGNTVNKAYIERLRYELNVIKKMGFGNYFLVVWDYVKYAKDQGILVGPGRGSAAGSLVSYCLNITDVDPLKYNLLFERFLNPERITMPDIDIDFEYNRREEVINYCINKYGIKRVAPIITFGTLGAKQAIRDVGRAMDIDLKIIDHICHFIDSRLTLLENYNQSPKLKKYLSTDEELMKLYKIALKFEGLKRHTSIHAAGIVMADRDLDEVIPLDKSHNDFYVTGYSMEYLEELGLLKMDFLALRNLTLINDVISDINKHEKITIDFNTIPLNDEKAIKIFTDVKTIGIFQFESVGMMNFLRKFKPSNFEDIFAAIALFRPGPMNNIDSYIKRKQGKEKIDYLHPDLEKILKPTYGIIVYQEQIMQIASVMAGYSLGEADVLRRAMSKKKEEVLLEEKEKFIKRSIERGYSEEVANKVYDLILKFASYGFNRAHSVAYAIIAYKMAYLKANYPKYFIKGLLSMVIGSEVKTKEYIYESKLENIKILKPDINLSSMDYQIEEFGIRYPLTNIKNVGISAVNTILEERKKGKFIDIFDFVKRTYGKSINRKTLESLIDAGCFTSLGLNKHTLHHNLDTIINYGELIKDLDDEYTLKPELEIMDEYPKKELMQRELGVFGFYLSEHPVTEYKVKYLNTISLNEIPNYFDKIINIIVYIDRIKVINTKKNERMSFITGSDEISKIDIILFPNIYEKYQDLKVGDIIYVTGKVEKRFDKLQVVVNEINKV
ncbi:MAG: DNA polymerase III subunit alpha [Mollicutes bacterium]|nr:DNA polymerase III subunit alpha [Mollicutes bacterium]